MASGKAYSVEARLNALITQAGPVAANASVTPVTVNGPTELSALTVPGGTMAATVKWVMEAQGFVSTGGVPTAMNFACYWGPVGNAISGTQLQSLSIPSAGLVGSWTNIGWHIAVTVFATSSTAVSVSIRLSWHTATGVGGSVYYFSVGTQTGLTTGADRDLDLAFGYSGAGVTITTHAVHITRTA